MKNGERCENCRFFQEMDLTKHVRYDRCLRRSPGQGNRNWPEVFSPYDWCGEHEPKSKADERTEV